MELNHESVVEELMRGAYDLHTHTNPSYVHRALDDFQLLQEAAEAGMAGVMIKSHYEPTQSRAHIVNMKGGYDSRAYGCIVLNHPAGGINPYAVENALKCGAKMVWMPTMDAAHCQNGSMGGFCSRLGIRVMNDAGDLDSRIYDIFDLCRQYNVPLATGHISQNESHALCKEGVARGVTMILTHPDWPKTRMSLETQMEFVKMGVYIEKLWYNVAEGLISEAMMIDSLMKLDPEKTFMATDRGQQGREHPVEGLKRFIDMLLDKGISESRIIKMVKTNPQYLVGE